jgi:hypothetical protein
MSGRAYGDALARFIVSLEHTLPPTYQRLVNAGAEYKSISPSSDVALEEWAMPLVLGLQIRHLKQSLREIERHGTPQIPANSQHVLIIASVLVCCHEPPLIECSCAKQR